MNKKINKVIIGEGEELIENWNYGFETIDSSLNHFINEAAEFKIKLDWYKIIKTFFYNSNIKKNFKPACSLELYSLVECLNINHEKKEENYPGGDIDFIIISANKENLNNIKDSLNKLIKYLEEYWINNGINIMSLKKEIEIKNDNIIYLKNKIVEKDKEIESFTKAALNNKHISDDIILIISFLIHPTELFYKKGPLLLTKNKTLFIIVNYQNNSEHERINNLIKILKMLQFNIIEVKEFEIDKSELRHISIFRMGSIDQLRGWSQKNTLLECLNNGTVDPLKIREDYIIWSQNVNK